MRLLNDGQTIRDTYEVERFLGEGAFAEVYRVRHRFLGRQAMKVFKRVGMALDEIHDMLGEAILLSRIGHPNIVRVFDANVLETQLGTCGYATQLAEDEHRDETLATFKIDKRRLLAVAKREVLVPELGSVSSKKARTRWN
jgi:serine/threonine protein kinase